MIVVASKLNLPNTPGGQNQNNLVSEYDEYVKIYKNWNRTTSGSYSIGPLASSGKSYSTNDYPNDTDVYNRGQEGMLSLLYKYVLKNYLIDVETLQEITKATNEASAKAEAASSAANDIITTVGNMPIVYDIIVENSNGIYSVKSGLPGSLPHSIFDIRFIAPSVCVAGNSIRLVSGGSVIPIKLINGKTVPASTWAKDVVLQFSVNNTGDTPSVTLSGGGGASGFLVSASAPNDTSVLWIDSSNGYFAKVWDGSK